MAVTTPRTRSDSLSRLSLPIAPPRTSSRTRARSMEVPRPDVDGADVPGMSKITENDDLCPSTTQDAVAITCAYRELRDATNVESKLLRGYTNKVVLNHQACQLFSQNYGSGQEKGQHVESLSTGKAAEMPFSRADSDRSPPLLFPRLLHQNSQQRRNSPTRRRPPSPSSASIRDILHDYDVSSSSTDSSPERESQASAHSETTIVPPRIPSLHLDSPVFSPFGGETFFTPREELTSPCPQSTPAASTSTTAPSGHPRRNSYFHIAAHPERIHLQSEPVQSPLLSVANEPTQANRKNHQRSRSDSIINPPTSGNPPEMPTMHPSSPEPIPDKDNKQEWQHLIGRVEAWVDLLGNMSERGRQPTRRADYRRRTIESGVYVYTDTDMSRDKIHIEIDPTRYLEGRHRRAQQQQENGPPTHVRDQIQKLIQQSSDGGKSDVRSDAGTYENARHVDEDTPIRACSMTQTDDTLFNRTFSSGSVSSHYPTDLSVAPRQIESKGERVSGSQEEDALPSPASSNQTLVRPHNASNRSLPIPNTPPVNHRDATKPAPTIVAKQTKTSHSPSPEHLPNNRNLTGTPTPQEHDGPLEIIIQPSPHQRNTADTPHSHTNVAPSSISQTGSPDTQSEPNDEVFEYVVDRGAGTVSKVLVAATKARIVDYLTSEADYEFIADFFVTYRLYLSPPELLSLIENRFKWALSQLEGDPYQKARNGCLIILHHWIKFHYDLDFVTSKPLRTAFGSFLVTDLESHPIIQNSSLYSRIVVVLKELIVDGRAKYRKRVREQRQLDQAQQTTSQQATTTPYENGGTIAPAHTQTSSKKSKAKIPVSAPSQTIDSGYNTDRDDCRRPSRHSSDLNYVLRDPSSSSFMGTITRKLFRRGRKRHNILDEPAPRSKSTDGGRRARSQPPFRGAASRGDAPPLPPPPSLSIPPLPREKNSNLSPTSSTQFPRSPTSTVASDSHSFIRDYPPDQVARHLSMAEQRLINRVPWTELLDAKVWKSRTAGQAEGVWKVIERFNNTCKWVIDEVTFAEGTEDKVQLIEVFVRIAQACLAYSNFSTLLSILLALQKPGIRSLESCWANLAVGVLDTLRSLQEFSTPFQNFKGVRQGHIRCAEGVSVPNWDGWKDAQALGLDVASGTQTSAEPDPRMETAQGGEARSPPLSDKGKGRAASQRPEAHGAVPFLGLILSDLAFVEEQDSFLEPFYGMDHDKDHTPRTDNVPQWLSSSSTPGNQREERVQSSSGPDETHLINVSRARRVAKVIRQFLAFQQPSRQYTFPLESSLWQRVLTLDA